MLQNDPTVINVRFAGDPTVGRTRKGLGGHRGTAVGLEAVECVIGATGGSMKVRVRAIESKALPAHELSERSKIRGLSRDSG